MEYNNPTSVYYCAKNSFQRFLDLSSCIAAEVSFLGTVVLPKMALELMIMKERTNATLVSHFPLPPNVQPSYYECCDHSFTLPRMSEFRGNEENCDTSSSSCQKFFVTTSILHHLTTFRFEDDATLDIELHCFSPFTLSVSQHCGILTSLITVTLIHRKLLNFPLKFAMPKLPWSIPHLLATESIK